MFLTTNASETVDTYRTAETLMDLVEFRATRRDRWRHGSYQCRDAQRGEESRRSREVLWPMCTTVEQVIVALELLSRRATSSRQIEERGEERRVQQNLQG